MTRATQFPSPPADAERRLWVGAASALGGAGLVATAVPFVASFAPSEKARALGAPVDVELGSLRSGELRTVEWRGKPVFVLRRTPEMIDALALAKQGSDMCTSGLSQRIAIDALDAGLLERTLPVILDVYRRRRDALCAAMAEHLSEWFDWEKPVGGMFVWASAKEAALNTDTLLAEALKAGVCVTPGSVFDPLGRDRRSIRVNFTLGSPERLAEGTRRLAIAVAAAARG